MRRILVLSVAFVLLPALVASAGENPRVQPNKGVVEPDNVPEYCRMITSLSYAVVVNGYIGWRESVSAFTAPDNGEGHCSATYTTKLYRIATQGGQEKLQDSRSKKNAPAWVWGGASCGIFRGCSGYRSYHSSTFYFPPLKKSAGLF